MLTHARTWYNASYRLQDLDRNARLVPISPEDFSANQICLTDEK
jgi:hypothetical protein